MKMPMSAVCDVVEAVIRSDSKTATAFLSASFTVKATRRHRASRRNTCNEIVVTFGTPNYLERKFIRECRKAGEPFPVRKVQLKAWPQKRK